MISTIIISKNNKLIENLKEFCAINGLTIVKILDGLNDETQFLKQTSSNLVFIDFELGESFVKQCINDLENKNFNLVFFVENFNDNNYNFLSSVRYKVFCYDFSYIDLKRYLFESLLNLNEELEEYLKLEEYVSTFCIEAGISPHLSGYHYIVCAILLVVKDTYKYRQLTKTVYPEVAKKFNVGAGVVERTIRHDLEVAQRSGKIEKINELVKVNVVGKNEKLSNGQFILLVADRLISMLKLKKFKSIT